MKPVKDFTKGNIIKQLWSVAWPMMLTIFFYTFYNLVDTFWVSKISTDAIAAVGISQMALMVIMTLSMWISIWSSVVTSINIWKGDKPEASRVMWQSFLLATIFWVIFTIISLLFRHEIISISGWVGTIFDPALEYFTIVAAGSILLFYLINIMMVFNAEGDTFTVTKLFALSTVINIALDPILIFWKFGFPELWIMWAGYATLVSQLVFIIIAMRILSSKKRSVRFSIKNLTLKKYSVKQVFNIGVPAAFTQVINPIWLAILTYMVATKFFEAWVTSFSLVFRLEFFAYLPAVWFSMAAMSMIGQNIWGWNMSRAHEIFKKASILGFGSAIILWGLLIIFWKTLLGAFTTDPTVIEYAMNYLYIVAWTYGFLSVSMVVASAFQSIGKSWYAFWLMFIKFFIIIFPLSYSLTYLLNYNINSIWASLAIWNVLLGIVGYIWNEKIFRKMMK